MPEFEMTGQCDGIRRLKNLRGVLEFKTIKSDGWHEKYGPLPLPEHVNQANIYALAFKADFINLIYINKDTAEDKEFVLLPQPELVKPLLAKILVGIEVRETDTPPEAKHRVCGSIKDGRAQSCAFAEMCFGQKRPLSLV
jgi:hypothetical protein